MQGAKRRRSGATARLCNAAGRQYSHKEMHRLFHDSSQQKSILEISEIRQTPQEGWEMSSIIILDESNYGEVTSKGVVIVDFYADWCSPCKMMEPVFAEANEAFAEKAVFAKLNIDASKSIAIQNRVMGIPTILFFKDGAVADRVTGVIDQATLYKKIEALL